MALYSSTLIIKHKTEKTDAQLLKELKLFQRSNHKIGKENTDYNSALSEDSESIFVTSTEDFVIIIGIPLINDFIYTMTCKRSITKTSI